MSLIHFFHEYFSIVLWKHETKVPEQNQEGSGSLHTCKMHATSLTGSSEAFLDVSTGTMVSSSLQGWFWESCKTQRDMEVGSAHTWKLGHTELYLVMICGSVSCMKASPNGARNGSMQGAMKCSQWF